MPNKRYFAFNSLAGAFRSSPNVVDGVTTAGRFDSSFVSDCIEPGLVSDYIQTPPFADGQAAESTEFWLRADYYGGGTNNTSSGILVYFFNSSDRAIVRIYNGGSTSNGTFDIDYWNGSTYTSLVTNSSIMGSASRKTLTFKLTLGAASSLLVYVNGTLFLTLPINDTDVNNVAYCRLGRGNNNVGGFWSQVMGANYDIRDAHYFAKKPNGNGTYTAGSGSYTDVDDVALNEADNTVLSAVGDKETYTHGGITLPAGYIIETAVVNGRVRKAGTVVADAQFLIRSGTTDDNGVSVAANGGFEPRCSMFDADPATLTRFTEAGFDALEFGLEAV